MAPRGRPAAPKPAAKAAAARRPRVSDSDEAEESDEEVVQLTAAVERSVGGAMSGLANVDTPGSPSPRTPSRSGCGRAPPDPKEVARVQALIDANPNDLRALTADEVLSHQPHLRSDITHHPVIAYCTRCATNPASSRRACHMYFVRSKKLSDHLLEHNDAAAAAEAPGRADAKEMLRTTVIHWAVRHRIGERALREMYAAFGEYISCLPLANVNRAFPALPKGLIAKAANRSNAAVIEAVNDSPFLAMSVDGGRWSHRGVYMMVFVAHTSSDYFVLRPVSSTTPFDGEKIAEVWMSVAAQLKRPVHHVMADGCTANVAAFKGIRVVAKILARAQFDEARRTDESDSDLLTDDDVEEGALEQPAEEAVEEEAVEVEAAEEAAAAAVAAKPAPRASIFDHICAGILKSCPTDVVTRSPMRLTCLPHWLKCRVLRAHRSMNPNVILAVTLLTRALHSPHGPSVRREQLKCFLQRILRESDNAKTLVIPEVCAAIDSVIEHLDDFGFYSDGAQALVNEIVAKFLPWAPLMQDYDPSLDPDTVATLSADTPQLLDKLRAVRNALDKIQGALPGPKKSVALATANETRWHSSLYMAFVFLSKYLAPIRDFFRDEKNQTSDSAIALFKLLDSKTQFDLLQKTLDDYVRTLEPVANLLRKISDVSSARFVAHRVYGLFSNLIGELSRLPVASAGFAVCQEIRNKIVDDDDFESTMQVFWHVQLFDPHSGTVVRKGTRFIDMVKNGEMRAARVRQTLNFTAEEFPDDEWDDWLQSTFPEARTFKENPIQFWDVESIVERFPKLRLVAKYLLSLPVSVTSCDSALSVMGSMFDATHNRLRPDAAAATLALRCNGDVAKHTVKPNMFPQWTKSGTALQ